MQESGSGRKPGRVWIRFRTFYPWEGSTPRTLPISRLGGFPVGYLKGRTAQQKVETFIWSTILTCISDCISIDPGQCNTVAYSQGYVCLYTYIYMMVYVLFLILLRKMVLSEWIAPYIERQREMEEDV